MIFKPTVFDLFRPVYEIRAAVGWVCATIACAGVGVLTGFWIHFFWFLPCGYLAYRWGARAVAIIAFKVQLSSNRLLFMPIARMMEICRWGQNPSQAPFEFSRGVVSTPAWWLGHGFEWQPSHAGLAKQILGSDREAAQLFPPWVLRTFWNVARFWRNAAATESVIYRTVEPVRASCERAVFGDTIKDKSPIGQSWIHALEPDKKPVLFLESAMTGHTLIVGAPGSGKTRLYESLTTQAIQGKNVVFILDPKFDTDWEQRCRRECEKAGKKYVYFNLAQLSQSVRLNPIKNWNDPSEIAGRIVGLLRGGSGNGEAFINFAHLSIDRAVKGLLFCGEQPTLKRIHGIVERGVAPILEKTLERVLTDAIGPEWKILLEATVTAKMQDAPGGKGPKTLDPLSAMVQIYLTDARLKPYRNEISDGLVAGVVCYDSYAEKGYKLDSVIAKTAGETLSGLITSHEHNKDHYGKMIITLLPLLGMLTSGEVGDTLSPDPTADDPREIWDMKRVIDENALIFLGLNTLANREVGQAIGSILLSEMAAVVGYIYNYVPVSDRKQVCLFVDEAAEVVNEQFVQILNKGRGANFRVFFATQTLADFHKKMGEKAAAEQLLGNANNFVCLRVQDVPTRTYMSELFGETVINESSVSSSMGTESDALALEFRGSLSYSTKKTSGPRVHPDLLGRLSNMHFFTMTQGGTIHKCVVPILKD
jgi:conjugal transfer pilus assembly protein TraD